MIFRLEQFRFGCELLILRHQRINFLLELLDVVLLSLAKLLSSFPVLEEPLLSFGLLLGGLGVTIVFRVALRGLVVTGGVSLPLGSLGGIGRTRTSSFSAHGHCGGGRGGLRGLRMWRCLQVGKRINVRAHGRCKGVRSFLIVKERGGRHSIKYYSELSVMTSTTRIAAKKKMSRSNTRIFL